MAFYFGTVKLDGSALEPTEIIQINPPSHLAKSCDLTVFGKGSFGWVQSSEQPEGHQCAPASLQCENFFIFGIIRLDNRNTLLRALDQRSDTDDAVPDIQLVLEAYKKWGAECTTRINGDFSFCVWHKRDHELFIGRDTFGTAEVYYYLQDKTFLFSSSLPVLLSHPRVVAQPNPKAIGLSLVLVRKADGSETHYRDIHQIPPANGLSLRNGKVKLAQYWSLGHIAPIRYAKQEDYLEDFLERMDMAVRARTPTRGNIGITLSGGVDSGVVTNLVAERLATRKQKLYAYTSVPVHDVTSWLPKNFLGDEGHMAQMTIGQSSGIEHTLVDSRGRTPIEGLNIALEILQHPLVAASNCYWLTSIYQAMQHQGIHKMLSGQFGNATISWAGTQAKLSHDLLKQGKLIRFISESLRYWKAKDLAPFDAMKQLFIAPLVPQMLLDHRRYLRAGSTPWSPNSPLNDQFAKSIKLGDLMRESGSFGYARSNPRLREFLLPVGMFAGSAVGASLASGFGLEFSDPTTDKRVIEFCWGIPESQYIQNGEQRLLIKRAFKGRVPGSVLKNQMFGLQSADLVMRLRESREEVEAELKQAARSPLSQDFLDIQKMNGCFTEALSTISYPVTLKTSLVLMRGLQMSKFLQRFEA